MIKLACDFCKEVIDNASIENQSQLKFETRLKIVKDDFALLPTALFDKVKNYDTCNDCFDKLTSKLKTHFNQKYYDLVDKCGEIIYSFVKTDKDMK
jgi:hypothetical protein